MNGVSFFEQVQNQSVEAPHSPDELDLIKIFDEVIGKFPESRTFKDKIFASVDHIYTIAVHGFSTPNESRGERAVSLFVQAARVETLALLMLSSPTNIVVVAVAFGTVLTIVNLAELVLSDQTRNTLKQHSIIRPFTAGIPKVLCQTTLIIGKIYFEAVFYMNIVNMMTIALTGFDRSEVTIQKTMLFSLRIMSMLACPLFSFMDYMCYSPEVKEQTKPEDLREWIKSKNTELESILKRNQLSDESEWLEGLVETDNDSESLKKIPQSFFTCDPVFFPFYKTHSNKHHSRFSYQDLLSWAESCSICREEYIESDRIVLDSERTERNKLLLLKAMRVLKPE